MGNERAAAMHAALERLNRLRQTVPVPDLATADLSGLSPDSRTLAASLLVLQGAHPPLPEGGKDLPLAWMEAWGRAILRHQPEKIDEWLPWLKKSEISHVLLQRLSLNFLPSDPPLAKKLAAAIHPLNKREYCLAHLEIALNGHDQPALEAALTAADAGPMIAQGAEECEALGQALVRLSRSPNPPSTPATQKAHQRLLKLAETRVDRDGRSYEIKTAVVGLLEADDPAWWELARPLVPLLHTPQLRREAELALRRRFPEQPAQPTPSGDSESQSLPDRVKELAQFKRYDEAEALLGQAGTHRLACREALVEHLVAAGEHERALSLAVESPQRLCSWAFHSLPRDLVPRALAMLEPVAPLDRSLALKQLGPVLSLAELKSQLSLLSDDRIRHRCGADLAAPWLERGDLATALTLLEHALLSPPEAPVFDSESYRNLSCEVWLHLQQPERARHLVEGCLDPSALALLRRTQARLGKEALATLSQKPESYFYSGDPPSPGCVGASLAWLIEAGQETQVASFFKGISDPQRKALGAFLRERRQIRAEFPFQEWTRWLVHRDRPCPLVIAELAPWLACLPDAESLIERLPESGTNQEEALLALTRERARQGDLEGCWRLAQRLRAYPLSRLCEDLQGLAPPAQLVETLKGISRKGMESSEKVVLERRLAQAELLAGKAKTAFKILEKMGRDNPVAPAQLAHFLWQWLQQNPSEKNPERIGQLWGAMSKLSPVNLALWAPRLLPEWIRESPERGAELVAMMPTEADQAVIWLSLGKPEKALNAAQEPGQLLSQIWEPTMQAALELPPEQLLRFFSRLGHLHPRVALQKVENLLAENADHRLALVVQMACQQNLFAGELGRQLTVHWARHLLRHQPQPVTAMEALIPSIQEPALLAGLVQLLRLAYRKENRPQPELEAFGA